MSRGFAGPCVALSPSTPFQTSDGGRPGYAATAGRLIYVRSGYLFCRTPHSWLWVPAGTALWVPVNAAYRIRCDRGDGLAFRMGPARSLAAPTDFRVVRAPPLMREMLLEGEARWEGMPAALQENFTETVELLALREWLDAPLALALPIARDPAIRAVVRDLRRHPAKARLERAVAVSGLTERTFRRRFEQAAELSWRALVTRARVVAGAVQLIDTPMAISEIAASVGFASASVFAAAFRRVLAETPASFAASRQRKRRYL